MRNQERASFTERSGRSSTARCSGHEASRLGTERPPAKPQWSPLVFTVCGGWLDFGRFRSVTPSAPSSDFVSRCIAGSWSWTMSNTTAPFLFNQVHGVARSSATIREQAKHYRADLVEEHRGADRSRTDVVPKRHSFRWRRRIPSVSFRAAVDVEDERIEPCLLPRLATWFCPNREVDQARKAVEALKLGAERQKRTDGTSPAARILGIHSPPRLGVQVVELMNERSFNITRI